MGAWMYLPLCLFSIMVAIPPVIGQDKPAGEEEFAAAIQGCWNEQIPASEPNMLSRHYCFEGGVEGEGATSYMSVNEGWDDTFTYVVRDGKLAVSFGETVVSCDASVVPGKVIKLSSCTGDYLRRATVLDYVATN